MDIRALNDLLAGNEKANGMFAVDYFPVLWYVFVKMILEEGISLIMCLSNMIRLF